jgi:hypothetical protein
VCHAAMASRTPEEQQANAALISAAPELLASLHEILEYTDCMDGHEDWPRIREAAEKAVAKAEGRAA